jgi:hypothetical protein
MPMLIPTRVMPLARLLARAVRPAAAAAAAAALVTLVTLVASGCATEDSARRDVDDVPPTAPFAETRSSGKLLAETQAQNRALKDELDELDKRIGSALSAINWNLRRYPECIDALFHTAAELDLGSRSLGREQAALAAEIDTLIEARAAGTLELDELQRGQQPRAGGPRPGERPQRGARPALFAHHAPRQPL